MNDKDIEIVPNLKMEPFFSPEEYEEFRQWWHREVVPELKRLEERHVY